ncbi:hypothetical protein ACP70R_009123 [Stipagrostis hirtigluma subsp. patula]
MAVAVGFCKPLALKMALRRFRTEVQMFKHRIRGSVTFSTVPQVAESEVGRFVPSYVTLTKPSPFVRYEWGLQHLDRVGKRVAVGELAKRKMWIVPSDVIYNIKHLIGKRFDETSIQEMRSTVHFSIIVGPEGEAWVEIHGRKFSPVEITSAILAKLKDIVLLYRFHHELRVVISVPVFFDKQQKEDILSAGHSAGLKILQLIDEPIAAALSSTTIENGVVIVFGMGAGSYSVAILHVTPDTNIEIISHVGDPYVGGDQFDNILVDYFVEQIIQLHSVDIRADKYAMMMLEEAAEQAKIKLSSQSEFTITIPFFPVSAEGPVDLSITISRTKFEKLVEYLVGQIKAKCQSILKDSNMSVKDINEVILFGGMTRVPKIRSIVSEIFGEYQSTRTSPDEAVVIGSAIQAAILVEDEQEISEDMIPLSIGIESAEGTFTRVIPRHTVVPTKSTIKIPGWCAYGERKHIRIYFGEHAMVEHNLCLGEVEVISNQSSYQGYVDIELTFEVDRDYLVKVSATNAGQGETADYGWRTLQAFQIKEEHRCKQKVHRAVKKALLDWSMYGKGIDARLRNLARYAMNTLDDVLCYRKNELPKENCEDAVDALADLQKSLYGDVAVLKDKLLYARKVESFLLNWFPPSGSHDSDVSDYEMKIENHDI